MSIAIAALIFLIVAGGLFALGSALLVPSSGVAIRLNALVNPRSRPERERPVAERVDRGLELLSKALPKSDEKMSETRSLLVQAGYREPRHLHIFYGLRVLGAATLLCVAIFTGLAGKSPLLSFALPALGYILPGFMLKRRITARQLRIQLALPDALDLAIICVEAGLGLDQSLNRVGTELATAHPDLADELRLLNLEMRAGKPRADALRNLARRANIDDIRAFVAVLIQTDRFGTSIASALRVHADALRTERRQRAEERAAKTTIKMIPVLLLFIFPVMFFVILGPMVISFVREVKPMLTH